MTRVLKKTGKRKILWYGDPGEQFKSTYKGARAKVWVSKERGFWYIKYRVTGTDIFRFTWLVEQINNLVNQNVICGQMDDVLRCGLLYCSPSNCFCEKRR